MGSDRRTVKRRVEANGIRPIGSSGAYAVYDFEVLRDIMRGGDDAGGRNQAHDQRYLDGYECGQGTAIYSVGEALPGALKRNLAACGLKASGEQLDRLAWVLWIAVAERIENDSADMQLPSGRLVESILENGEYPEALKPIVARMQEKKGRAQTGRNHNQRQGATGP